MGRRGDEGVRAGLVEGDLEPVGRDGDNRRLRRVQAVRHRPGTVVVGQPRLGLVIHEGARSSLVDDIAVVGTAGRGSFLTHHANRIPAGGGRIPVEGDRAHVVPGESGDGTRREGDALHDAGGIVAAVTHRTDARHVAAGLAGAVAVVVLVAGGAGVAEGAGISGFAGAKRGAGGVVAGAIHAGEVGERAVGLAGAVAVVVLVTGGAEVAETAGVSPVSQTQTAVPEESSQAPWTQPRLAREQSGLHVDAGRRA